MAGIHLGTFGALLFKRPFRVSIPEIKTHIHVIGITGSGKSRFLAGLYLELVRNKLPATLIDPHGDLARLVLDHLIAERIFDHDLAYERVLYLDIPTAAAAGHYLPFNVLAGNRAPHTTAANVMEAMHRAWPALGAGGAPMFDTFIQNGVKVLLSNKLPLPQLYDLLTYKDYRDRLLEQEDDRRIVSFFHNWYDRLPIRDQLDASASTIRRVQLLTFDPVLQYSLGQKHNVLNFRPLMDDGRSSLINMAIDNAEAKRLVGCLLTVAVEQAALSRADLPPESRGTSHHLFLDEFSQFVAQSGQALSTMLSETRKFNLSAVLSHQTWGQADRHLQSSLQNVGIEILFALGPDDAGYFSRLVARVDPKTVTGPGEDEHVRESEGMNEQWELFKQELADQPQQHAYVSKRNRHRHRFLIFHLPARTLTRIRTADVPDPRIDPKARNRVLQRYQELYFRPKAEVEDYLNTVRATEEPFPKRRAKAG